MGTLWSTHFPGSPLWVLIVTPPSGSKSETLMPVSEWHRCHAISSLTSKSLISGFQEAGGGDPSLLAELDGKQAAIIVKDLTPLLGGRGEEVEEVFGILRDAYDGETSKLFGNGVKREYNNLSFAFIAGVTPAIDAYNAVAMGERFIKFRADKELDREDDLERAMRMLDNTGTESEMKTELKDACVRALVRKLDPKAVPKPCQKFKRIVADLAFICARMRAVAPVDQFTGVQAQSAVVEAPTRLAGQFMKLAQGLAMHFEATTLMDPRIVRLVKRVALHTPDIVTARIFRALYDSYELEGRTVKDLASSLIGVNRETMRYVLSRLTMTMTCEEIRVEADDHVRMYRMHEEIYKMIQRQKLFDNLPKNDPLYRGKRLVLKRKNK